jgi:CRP-like cAMP-binding protein
MSSRRTQANARTTGLKLTYLKGTELVQDFTLEELEPFHHTIRMATCPAGHVFYRPGETGEVMFLLKAGAAQLYRMSPDGRKFVFAQVPPASVFGEMSCIGQAMYECFAEATTESVICMLSRADVQRLILDYPRFAVRLLRPSGIAWSRPSANWRISRSSRWCRAWRTFSAESRATGGWTACRTRISVSGLVSIARPRRTPSTS